MAARKLPYTWAEAKKDSRLIATYEHRTPKGAVTMIKAKFPDPEEKRDKVFVWYGAKEEGRVVAKQPEGVKRYLYRIADVELAIEIGDPVWLHEGEKGADAAREAGWPGAHTATMDGSSLFDPWAGDQLSGAEVVVVVDRDDPGEKWARKVAEGLRGKAKRARFVQPPVCCGAKADAYDVVAAGLGPDEMQPRADLDDLLIHPAVKLLHLAPSKSDFTVRYEFVWEPWLVKGKLTLCEGEGGVGKTSFALAIAACIGNGVVPGTTQRREPANTLVIAVEDDPEELRTVYQAMEGDHARLAIFPSTLKLNADGMEAMRAMIRATDAEYVYIDGIFDLLQGQGKSANDGLDVTEALLGLARIASDERVAIMFTRHTGKSKQVDAKDRGIGSVMFRNKARSQAVLDWHPDRAGVIVVYHGRASLLMKRSLPVAFRHIEVPGGCHTVEWVQLPEEERERLMGEFTGRQTPGPGRPAKSGAVAQTICRFLEEFGPRNTKDLVDALTQKGLAQATVYRALKALPLQKDQFGRLHLPPGFTLEEDCEL